MNITTNILCRTFLIEFEENTGTGFTIEYNEKQYLISCKHLFQGTTHGQNITFGIRNDKEGIILNGNIYFHPVDQFINVDDDPQVDISVIQLEKDISPRYPIKYGECGNHIGQDLYFLGFPFGKYYSQDDWNINKGFPLPFVKKATLSAMNKDYNECRNYYLDGHNNYGFSGGPVIFEHLQEIHILGINIATIPDEMKELEIEYPNDEGTLDKQKYELLENSGIFCAIDIRMAMIILKEIY